MEQTQNPSRYRVDLGDVFEGPMDLLVHLVKKNEVDIYDIPIALIMEQYLQYLNILKALNIDVAGDFLVMAATLAHIKSRMLLPIQEEEEEDTEDPRMEIVRPLEEYLQLKYAADDLGKRDRLDWDIFVCTSSNGNGSVEGEAQDLMDVSLFELIDAFQKIIERISPEDFLNITVEAISVKNRISEIVDLLEERGSIAFEELFEKETSRSYVIVTFLAILEMAKAQIIRIMQHVQSGIIRIFHG